MSDSFDSAYGPSVGTGMPFWKRTVLAWLPSASPSALTSSPDFLRSSSSLPMNRIISTIHSLPMVASPSSADPNVMIMYFTDSLLQFGALHTRSHQSVGAVAPFSTSGWARFSGGASAPSPPVGTSLRDSTAHRDQASFGGPATRGSRLSSRACRKRPWRTPRRGGTAAA